MYLYDRHISAYMMLNDGNKAGTVQTRRATFSQTDAPCLYKQTVIPAKVRISQKEEMAGQARNDDNKAI